MHIFQLNIAMSYNPFLVAELWMTDTLGLDLASCKILVCLTLSFPFSAVFKRLPDSNINLKNTYLMVVSAIYIVFILQIGSGFFVLLANALFTYAITRYYKSRTMPWINFVVLMLLMCMNHLRTQFTRLDVSNVDIDITGAQMVLVMKLTSFAWSYRDGMLYHDNPKRFASELNQFQKSRAILNQPSLISYLGYVFFYASIVTGPSFDYADYDRFILTEAFDDIPESKRPGKHRKRKIPRSGRVALLKVVEGIAWAILLLLLRDRITVEHTQDTSFRTEHTFVYRIFYYWALGFVFRLKYYTAWLVSEAACIVVGLGYNGYDPKTNRMYWNRVQNVDPWGFESGQNVHDCLEAWNMNTNKWLKNFVYLRCCNTDKETGKPKSGVLPTFATFFTSAFWHGTMPGYYLTFIAGAIIQTVGRVFRHYLRPIFISKDGSNVSPWKPVYDLVCWLVTQLSFGYVAGPFIVLEFWPSIYYWASCYFWVHLGSFIVLFLFNGPLAPNLKKFFKQYFILPTVKEMPKLERKITHEDRLETLKHEFGSNEDVNDLLKQSNESQASLPSYDSQSELHDTVPSPGVDLAEGGLEKLTSEFAEWKKEVLKGKQPKELTDEELETLKKGLESFQTDVSKYINSIETVQATKRKIQKQD